MSNYADRIGLAFQIKDDILDVTGSAEKLGKNIGSDIKNNKKTVLGFMSIEEAEEEEYSFTKKAIDALSSLPENKDVLDLSIWLLNRDR